jgi:hypothetical protein
MNGLDHWNFYDVGGHATLWFPAPEWAHQLIDHLASMWTEHPWTTEVFLFIPRVNKLILWEVSPDVWFLSFFSLWGVCS